MELANTQPKTAPAGQAAEAEQRRRADAFPALLEAAKRVLEFYTETRWVPDCDLADLRDAIAAAEKRQP